MIKCLIFDFDGVIIDSIGVQRYAYNESCKTILGENTSYPPFDEFLKHSGDSLTNIFTKMNLPLTLIDIYRRVSRESVDKIIVINEVIDVIRTVRTKGIQIGLCTGKDRIRTIEILKYFNIFDLFDTIVCSDDVQYPKPHEQSLLRIADTLNLPHYNCIMIGDGCYDILAADNANMPSILTKWCDGNVTDCSPTYIANSTAEFSDIISKII